MVACPGSVSPLMGAVRVGDAGTRKAPRKSLEIKETEEGGEEAAGRVTGSEGRVLGACWLRGIHTFRKGAGLLFLFLLLYR